MSDLFDISISALQAFKSALAVTSQNIANANTPGYAQESIQLNAAAPQGSAATAIGGGVTVGGVSRAIDTLNQNQLTSSQSTLGQLGSLQTYTNQLDNIVGTTAGGLTTALQNYYSAWSTLANDPTSAASRQTLLAQAQAVANSFQSTSSQLQGLNSNIDAGISIDVGQINSLASSIATLNTQIVTARAQQGNQAPNELLDQRDQAVSSLSKLVGVTTSTEGNGSLNVFVGNGQSIVLGARSSALATVPNQFDATQLEVTVAGNSNNVISSQITSGDLGGLLAARSQVVNPALNQVGQIATGLAVSANAQQNSGLDLTGALGKNLFSVAAPQATASSRNSSAVTASVGPIGSTVGALTTNDYLLAYRAGAYSLTNAATEAAVAFTGNGTAGNPIVADGLSITLSGTPSSGDQFSIKPTAQAASSFAVTLANPSQLAAAAALKTAASNANTGSGTIGGGSVVTPTNASLLAPVTIRFTAANTYTINGAGSNTYTPGGTIAQNGWQVQISGTPAVGDVFTVQGNAGATGDNRNALAAANQQTQGVLVGGTTTINAAANALVTAVGSQAQQVNNSQTAQTAVNTQALAAVQSVSGVNLDQEAANLVQWQQAYQASANALQIGNQTFQTLLTAISAG